VEELFRAHWPLLYGYLLRRTGDRELAADLAQETFLRATRSFLGWRGGSAAAWLLAIARNVLVDAVRAHRSADRLDDTVLAPVEVDDGPLLAREQLQRLPSRDRDLLLLVHGHGYSHAEIAAMSGTTAAAVRTAVYRARQRARDILENPA
jgi:RNA polymerase sigma-70 factor (ECF subfamily)